MGSKSSDIRETFHIQAINIQPTPYPGIFTVNVCFFFREPPLPWLVFLMKLTSPLWLMQSLKLCLACILACVFMCDSAHVCEISVEVRGQLQLLSLRNCLPCVLREGLDLWRRPRWPTQALRGSCLCLPGAGIIFMCHST